MIAASGVAVNSRSLRADQSAPRPDHSKFRSSAGLAIRSATGVFRRVHVFRRLHAAC
jgi:hypothetical protein